MVNAGDVTLDIFGTLTVRVGAGYWPEITDEYTLIDLGPGYGVNGTFSNAPLEGSEFFDPTGNFKFRISYAGGPDENDVVVTLLVPEPGTLGLLALGSLAGLLLRRFRRARR